MSANGHTTVIVEEKHTVTTKVERHTVTLHLSRAEVGCIVAALSLAPQHLPPHLTDKATALLWKIVDEMTGPTRTIDRRLSAEEERDALAVLLDESIDAEKRLESRPSTD